MNNSRIPRSHLIISEEVSDLPRGQQVIDQNQEYFIGDLGIGHKEYNTKTCVGKGEKASKDLFSNNILTGKQFVSARQKLF